MACCAPRSMIIHSAVQLQPAHTASPHEKARGPGGALWLPSMPRQRQHKTQTNKASTEQKASQQSKANQGRFEAGPKPGPVGFAAPPSPAGHPAGVQTNNKTGAQAGTKLNQLVGMPRAPASDAASWMLGAGLITAAAAVPLSPIYTSWLTNRCKSCTCSGQHNRTAPGQEHHESESLQSPQNHAASDTTQQV